MRHILVKYILRKIHTVLPEPFKQILIDMYIYSSSTWKGAKNIQGIKFDKHHIDACVIGNGPSLEKDRETLKQLIDKNDFICVNNFCDDHIYSQSNIKKIQWDWDEFFVASVGVGTASQKNLYQFLVIK